jgi:hypothetical protein
MLLPTTKNCEEEGAGSSVVASNVPRDLCDSDNHNTFFATAVHELYILSRVIYPCSNDGAIGRI